MNLPTNLLYSKEHEWIQVGEDHARIGITEFAQGELGDIVFIELPEVGDEIRMDETFGSIESVKTVSELYAPLNGKIIKVNDKLEDNPELINESPYNEAWIIIIKPFNDAELKKIIIPWGIPYTHIQVTYHSNFKMY